MKNKLFVFFVTIFFKRVFHEQPWNFKHFLSYTSFFPEKTLHISKITSKLSFETNFTNFKFEIICIQFLGKITCMSIILNISAIKNLKGLINLVCWKL